MNTQQQKNNLHTADDHINRARRSAWDVIELGNPDNDSIGLERKLTEARKSLKEVQYCIESAKNYLDGILIEVKK